LEKTNASEVYGSALILHGKRGRGEEGKRGTAEKVNRGKG